MFESPQSQTSDQFRTAVDPPAAAHAPKRIVRTLKIGTAAALLCAALYAITVGQTTITSDNAVLTAYTVSIRAPVAGIFAGGGLRVGDGVAQGGVLGSLHDDRVDERAVIDLEGQIERSAAERRALGAQRLGLLGLRAELLDRATAFQSADQDFQAQSFEEASRGLHALVTENVRLRRDLDRTRHLVDDGRAPSVDLDARQAELDISDDRVAAQEAVVARTRIAADASGRGLLLGNGANDTSYSRQRTDDVTLWLSEIDRADSSYAAAGIELESRLVAERRQLSRLRDVVLTAPTDGTIWRIGVSDGERLAVGEVAVQMVDCRSGFILAAIPQDRFGDVEIGGAVRYRLSGETEDGHGSLVAVMAEPDAAQDRNVAAAPAPGRGETLLARIEVPAGNGPCAIGRTVRVLMPAQAGSGPLARLVRWVRG